MIFMFIYLFIGMAAMAKHNQQKHFMMINKTKKKITGGIFASHTGAPSYNI